MAACRMFFSMRPNMITSANGKMQDVHAREEVRPRVRVLVGMGRVGAEEAAAVGAEMLDGDDGGDRTAGDFLRFGGTAFVAAHRSRFERRDFGRRLERHGHAVGHQAPRPSRGWRERRHRRRSATGRRKNFPCVRRRASRGRRRPERKSPRRPRGTCWPRRRKSG